MSCLYSVWDIIDGEWHRVAIEIESDPLLSQSLT